MQIPGAAEKAHLYQRQRLTGRAAHAAAPCRPNAAQHFKSPGKSPAACFKMQLLFCLCILRVLCGLCTVHPESFPAISEESLCFRHIRSLRRQKKARSFRLNFPPASGPPGALPGPFPLPRLPHRVLRRRNLTSLLLHSPRLSARKLQTISVPVLLIAGTRDLIKPSHSRWLARQIPTSQLLLMTGGRHTSIFHTPAPYLRAILAFLRRS